MREKRILRKDAETHLVGTGGAGHDVCGIAGDVCVLDTLKDLVAAGYKKKLHVLTDFCPSLDGGKALRKYLKELVKN